MLVLHVMLALLWTMLTGDFSFVNLLFGLVLVWGVLGLTATTPDRRSYVRRLPRVVVVALVFLRELVVANLRVALAVVRPTRHLRPGIVAVPLDVRTDAAITLLANLITLTPGTLSLDLSTDRRVLYVHVMDLDDPDAFRKSVKDGLERRVREALES